MAVGAGLSSAAYVAAGQFKSPAPKPTAKMRIYDLGYQRPRSPTTADFKGIPDPLTAKLPSQALVELAVTCDVRQYKLDATDKGGFGGNPSAFLHIDPATLSDHSFNCLSEHLRPPYLNLSIIEVCRSMMEKNPANPPCEEPIR
jgi:hypothetical protein